MSAAVLHGREDLRIERVAIPAIAVDEVLIRVKVALTCGTDLKVWRRGYHARMIQPPALFGHELAGIIEAVGSAVSPVFRPGMRVVPANSAPCGVCFFCGKSQPSLCEDLLFNNGAYAEFIRVPDRIVRQNLLEIPEHVSFEEAAMIEPLACVLRGIDEIHVAPGDTSVVVGCGPIGLQFIHVLARRGVRVIALGKRKPQLDSAERFGAAAALDVLDEADPVRAVRQLTPRGLGADSVIEAVGTPAAWEMAVQAVRPGGTVNLFGGCTSGSEVRLDASRFHYSEITLHPTFHHTPHYIRAALDAIARGDIRPRDFITNEISLRELPAIFERMKQRKGELKVAVIP
jgi:L-iditol 2-dehydrogenase